MTQPTGGARLPPHLLPRSKAPATAGRASSVDAAMSGAMHGAALDAHRRPSTPAQASSRQRSSSPSAASSSRPGSRPRRAAPAMAAEANLRSPVPPDRVADVSDAATEALIRRVLCPLAAAAALNDDAPQPLEQLLPPLSSSNAADRQLYAILAIIVRDFVTSWYARITPDTTFVSEVIRLVAHASRELEGRLRHVDLESVLFDEVPELIREHVVAFRAATNSRRRLDMAIEPRTIYHALNPHPAFAPVPHGPVVDEAQVAHETYYRQLLAHGSLSMLLPAEDLQSPPLRILVADVVGELLLGRGVSAKACESWVIWDGIAVIAKRLRTQVEPRTTGAQMAADTRSRLEQYGLLAERPPEEAETVAQRAKRQRLKRVSVTDRLWRLLQYVYWTVVAVRFLVTGLFAAAGRPPQRNIRKTQASHDAIDQLPKDTSPPSSRPILSFAIFDLAGELLDFRGRAPWTLGALSFVRWHATKPRGWLGSLGATDGIIDKYLHQLLVTHLLTADRVPLLLEQIRATIFPNDALGPARPTPPLDEQLAIRRRAAIALLELLPQWAAKRFLAAHQVRPASNLHEPSKEKGVPPEAGQIPLSEEQSTSTNTETNAMIDDLENLLDVFGDAYMNKHLVFGIVELLTVRIIPEMGRMGVRELLEERGVAV